MRKSKYRNDFEYWFANNGFNLMADPAQHEYVSKMLAPVEECQAIFVDAKAGTGKTSLALTAAYYQLELGEIDKIVYVRSAVPTREIGFLPGTKEEKEVAFMRPAMDVLDKFGHNIVMQMVELNQIEFTTTSYLQGVDYGGDLFIIIDEAENFDLTELWMTLTRIHDTAKVVIIGSHLQVMDKKMKRYTADRLIPFQLFERHYQNHPVLKDRVASLKLTRNYRGSFSSWADEIMSTVDSLED